MKNYSPIDRDDAEQIAEIDNFFANNPNAESILIKASRPYSAVSATSILNRIEKSKTTTVSLRPKIETLEKIKVFAKSQGIPYQTFINAYLDELADSL